MDWIAQHWLEVVSLVLIAAGVWWLMPRAAAWPKAVGLILSLAGTVLLAIRMRVAEGPLGETVLFSIFAVGAILCAILMITNRNPVYSALWFAMATLCTCGLFLLQFAPFLAVATVIVYAGAIVVTFVFVIMLAQQSGATVYDQRSRHPLVATIASVVLLGALIGTLQSLGGLSEADDGRANELASASETPSALADLANPLSRPAKNEALGQMRPLGRSLFGDYLFGVELAGTLLLVATIGAIAIAPRRRRGTL